VIDGRFGSNPGRSKGVEQGRKAVVVGRRSAPRLRITRVHDRNTPRQVITHRLPSFPTYLASVRGAAESLCRHRADPGSVAAPPIITSTAHGAFQREAISSVTSLGLRCHPPICVPIRALATRLTLDRSASPSSAVAQHGSAPTASSISCSMQRMACAARHGLPVPAYTTHIGGHAGRRLGSQATSAALPRKTAPLYRQEAARSLVLYCSYIDQVSG
jgi:hypothetical protein